MINRRLAFGVRPVFSPLAPGSAQVFALGSALFFALVVGACAPASPSSSSGSGGAASGGNSGSGGATSSGGAKGSGGSSASSGGSTSSGGASTSSGGSTGSGGASTSSGGSTGAAGAKAASGGAAGGGGTAGAGGAKSGSGGSTNNSACKAGPPTPAAGGAAFPFPQHRFSPSCIYPSTCNDADMMAGWAAYKSHLMVDDSSSGGKRVQRPENQNDSVSEGVGYGLVLAVYMNEKDTFDALWKYEQKHLDSTGLMNWHINSDGSTASGGLNSATDGDEDMGFALVMADKQWGGYADTAKAFLSVLAKNDFESDGTVKGGDKYGNAVNPSYLAPAYYRTFAKYTGDATWMTILEKSYSLLMAATNTTNGLVPDWSSPAGRGPDYKYDAARTPFRIGLDACWNNEMRAVTFSQGIAKFFAAIGVMNIKDGYSLSTGMSISTSVNATFIGPAGVAGMAANQTQLVGDAYAFIADTDNKGTESYYNMSWALFSTLMMTGNFVDLTASP